MILEDGGWIYEIDTLDNENQRFDHFGCVKQIKYGNREFISEEKTPILYQNKGVGICSEFSASSPIGFDEAGQGDWFVKIGCGIMKKSGTKYSFNKQYSFIPLEVHCQKKDKQIQFFSEQEEIRGYAYQYTKCISINSNCLHINYRIKNTGNRVLKWQSYSHNFFAADLKNQTGYELYFENVKDLKFQNGEKILVSLKKGFQTCQLNQTESFYVAELEKEKRNGKVELIFPNNMKIVETQNFSPVKVKLWMAENCICPESFYEGCVMPGNTVEWMRSYCFGI